LGGAGTGGAGVPPKESAVSPYYGPNRRRDHRFKLRRQVHYRLMDGGDKDPSFHSALSADVSHHGLRVLVFEPLERGSQIEVFLLAGDGTPKVRGVVEVMRCIPKPVTNEYYNEYYNPDTMVEYDVGLKSAGSVLFSRVTDLSR
jgi:hypothetical protein